MDPTVSPRFKPRRALGRTGFDATLLGIGDLADRKLSRDQCVATARRAIDAGLNVIDTAPGYEDGFSEEIVGCAVRSTRDPIFVIDKIDQLDKAVAPQVNDSLERLGFDSVDLFVFHGVSEMGRWEHLIRPGGGFDQLANCVKAGKAKFRGVSSHHPEVVEAAILSRLCDVVMFPIGPFCDPRYLKLLVLAKKHHVGTVCFKTFGAGKLVSDTSGYNEPLQNRPRGKRSSGGADQGKPQLPHLTARECLHYTLTCDPDVALLGLSFPNEQDVAFAAARDFKKLAPDVMANIRTRAETAMQDKGPCWWNPA